MTTAQPPDELPVWAEKIHRTGRNISHALKPWRDLPWPRKTTITATAVAADLPRRYVDEDFQG